MRVDATLIARARRDVVASIEGRATKDYTKSGRVVHGDKILGSGIAYSIRKGDTRRRYDR